MLKINTDCAKQMWIFWGCFFGGMTVQKKYLFGWKLIENTVHVYFQRKFLQKVPYVPQRVLDLAS